MFNCDEGIDFQSMGRIFIGLVKVRTGRPWILVYDKRHPPITAFVILRKFSLLMPEYR